MKRNLEDIDEVAKIKSKYSGWLSMANNVINEFKY